MAWVIIEFLSTFGSQYFYISCTKRCSKILVQYPLMELNTSEDENAQCLTSIGLCIGNNTRQAHNYYETLIEKCYQHSQCLCVSVQLTSDTRYVLSCVNQWCHLLTESKSMFPHKCVELWSWSLDWWLSSWRFSLAVHVLQLNVPDLSAANHLVICRVAEEISVHSSLAKWKSPRTTDGRVPAYYLYLCLYLWGGLRPALRPLNASLLSGWHIWWDKRVNQVVCFILLIRGVFMHNRKHQSFVACCVEQLN